MDVAVLVADATDGIDVDDGIGGFPNPAPAAAPAESTGESAIIAGPALAFLVQSQAIPVVC